MMANDEVEEVPKYNRFKRPPMVESDTTVDDTAVEVEPTPEVANDLVAAAAPLIEAVEALPEPEPDPYGYVASTWGGNRKFQCKWCPWDVVESINGDYDIDDRMQLHLAACHNGEDGPAKYGSNGLPLLQRS
jgi:hypothetical protein